jgi:hypothetical protein
VDLSQAALASAAKKLSVLRSPVEVVHADIIVRAERSRLLRLIYTSFALHRLSIDEKAEAYRCGQEKP